MKQDYELIKKAVVEDFSEGVYNCVAYFYEGCLKTKKNLEQNIKDNGGEVNNATAWNSFTNNCYLECFEKLFDYLAKM